MLYERDDVVLASARLRGWVVLDYPVDKACMELFAIDCDECLELGVALGASVTLCTADL